jgi:hypothetical protein
MVDPSRDLTTALSGLMGRRLDRLTGDARSILNTAAVIGRVFVYRPRRGSAAPAPRTKCSTRSTRIEHAVLRRPNSSGCEFSFTHGLLVDAVRRGDQPAAPGAHP